MMDLSLIEYKLLWKKKKMLVTIILSFSRNVFPATDKIRVCVVEDLMAIKRVLKIKKFRP